MITPPPLSPLPNQPQSTVEVNGGYSFLSPVPLPLSVESLLREICSKQAKSPPDDGVRRCLSQVGEEAALQILNTISKRTINKSLGGYIMFMINLYKNSPASGGATARVSTQESASPPTPASSINGISSHSPLVKRQLFSPTSSSETPSTSRQRLHPQLLDPNEALNELGFRKAFFIRNYIGSAKLEDTVAADDIQHWKGLPMGDFESDIWNKLGKKYSYYKDNYGNISCDETERRKHSDWDSGMTHIYHCHVLQDGNYIFKGPFLSTTRTHLQRILGDENVLLVKLAEEASGSAGKISCSSNYSSAFNRIAEEGIIVGLRRYRFFVFKDGGKEEKKKNPTSSSVKCFFVRTNSLASGDEYPLSNKTMWESRCLFMHAHMVSTMEKYMARFSLILSKTIKLQVDISSVCIDIVDDIPCRDENGCIVYDEDEEPLIHTDGTGFISEDLALLTPKDFSSAKYASEQNFKHLLNVNCEKSLDPRESDSHRKEPPLLMQIRLFHNGRAVKGTLLVNKLLSPRTIVIRPSMIKVQMDSSLSNPPTFNSLEIVGISNKPRKTYLSKNLIALLNYGGVPKEYFLDIMESALKDAQTICTNKRAALRAAVNYGEMDDNIVVRMIMCGIPLNEPCLQSRLSIIANQERKGLKGGKLPISESFYLMGSADPTGLLERNQVCVILENGQVSGPVLVYRNPGLHFGDVHILDATYVEEMEQLVGSAKYGIFFSTKGRRSVGSELANGDFDGDMYWVSRNPQLLSSFKASEPWRRIHSTPSKHGKKPSELSPDELERELFHMFLRTRFQNSNCMGVAADSWLALIDRLLILGESCADEKNRMKKSMHQLVDLYYDALDAPKSGKKVEIPDDLIVRKFPHYMERERKYKSSSVLGLLYDMVESYQSANPATSGEDIWKLPLFNIEIPFASLELWRERYNNYRSEMSAALKSPEKELKDVAANGLIQRYKQLLYDAPEFEDSPKNLEDKDSPKNLVDIYKEAIAIYHVSYNRAIQTGEAKYCLFAWRVAGPALCKFYAANESEQSKKPIICSPSVLQEVL